MIDCIKSPFIINIMVISLLIHVKLEALTFILCVNCLIEILWLSTYLLDNIDNLHLFLGLSFLVSRSFGRRLINIRWLIRWQLHIVILHLLIYLLMMFLFVFLIVKNNLSFFLWIVKSALTLIEITWRNRFFRWKRCQDILRMPRVQYSR